MIKDSEKHISFLRGLKGRCGVSRGQQWMPRDFEETIDLQGFSRALHVI